MEALKEETFYGVAKLRQGEQDLELDARPSDILALAAQTGSPIYVGEEVLQAVGIEITEKDVAAIQPGKNLDILINEFDENWKQALKRVSAEEEKQNSNQELLDALFAKLA